MYDVNEAQDLRIINLLCNVKAMCLATKMNV